MKRARRAAPELALSSRFQPELMVVEYVATLRGEQQRGPMVRMNGAEARIRLVQDGELVWVQGPRRKELAELVIDDSVPIRQVALRDIAGVTLCEHVIVVKPDLDTPVSGREVG